MRSSGRCGERYVVRINCGFFSYGKILGAVGLRMELQWWAAYLVKLDLSVFCVPIPLSGYLALVERAGLGIIYHGFNTYTIYKLRAT